jgi:pleiotropic regulator 1
VFSLQGHRDTVNAIVAQGVDPQVVSSSVDSTVRLWDLAAGKCLSTLTNHKKGVRALAMHPTEFSFASASSDNIKTWAFPRGDFMRNLSGHAGLVNALAMNQDGVLASGGDDGNVRFWDVAAAHCFQTEQVAVQPGSMENEAGVFAAAFDQSGSRLITCEADKTIKVWREDESATPETHPLHFVPDLSHKRY